MKHLLPLLFSALFVLCSASIFGQKTITGTVTDAGEPLIGVNILISGTTSGTTTGIDGSYSLEVNEGDVLTFSYTGYQSVQITVGSDDVIDLEMVAGEVLEEIVVTAYGTQKKVTVTGAIAAIPGGDLTKSPAVNVGHSLSGRLPGLVAIQTSGEPGADDARIRIRGQNTLGNSSPLIVIDGIPDRDGGLARLNPNDIESISVLKDASAAIYGARAANGAIIITTKRGATGKPSVTYNFNQGWAQPTVIPEMSSAVEYANIINEIPIYQSIPVDEWSAASSSITSTGLYDSPTQGIGDLSAQFSPDAVRKHEDGSDPWGFPDTDWFGDAFRDWAPQNQHNLSISGGSENFRYFGSLGYIFQDGIYKNSATKFKQYNFRINVDADINEYFKLNLGVMSRREDRNYPTQSAGAIFRMLMRGRPTEPEVWPNGLPGPDIENGQNPIVITTNETGYVDDPSDLTQINGGIDIGNPWIEGLTLSLSGSVDRSNRTINTWRTPWMLYFWDRVSFEADGTTPLLEGAVRSNFKSPDLRQEYQNRLNTNLTAILRYSTEIGNGHTINALAGVTKESFKGNEFQAFRRDFISPVIPQLFAGSATGQETDGSAFDRARLGYYGRVEYNYQEKYLAEFIWRYDGSYIFPESERFGFFPGVLLGWNITSEDWFSINGLDRLKIRASYGEMGNDQVFFNDELQEYAFLSTFGFGRYPIDNNVQNTLTELVLANPNFTWERAKNFNIGIDATFLRDFDLSLEYFNNNRDQILIQQTGSTPASSGISTLLPPVNAGEVENSGFEFNLSYNKNVSNDFRYNVGFNGGYAKNTVIFLDEIPGAPDYQLQEGKPINAFLVYESDGAFLDQAEIEANTLDYSAVTGELLPGDMKFRDINGDGVINADDQTRLEENETPKFNFGVTFNAQWKNFDFAILFQGATGARFRLATESGDIGNYLKYAHDNRWSIANPSSEHPRLASRGDTYYTGGPYGNNTYWLLDRDYIRLKNMEIGYTLSGDALERIKINGLRFYVNGFNLLTWDRSGIFDPESENSAGTYYPQNRIINAGFSITF